MIFMELPSPQRTVGYSKISVLHGSVVHSAYSVQLGTSKLVRISVVSAYSVVFVGSAQP